MKTLILLSGLLVALIVASDSPKERHEVYFICEHNLPCVLRDGYIEIRKRVINIKMDGEREVTLKISAKIEQADKTFYELQDIGYKGLLEANSNSATLRIRSEKKLYTATYVYKNK